LYLGRKGKSLYFVDHLKQKCVFFVFEDETLNTLDNHTKAFLYFKYYERVVLEYSENVMKEPIKLVHLMQTNGVPVLSEDKVEKTVKDSILMLRYEHQKNTFRSWNEVVVSETFVNLISLKTCKKHQTCSVFKNLKLIRRIENCDICVLLRKRALPLYVLYEPYTGNEICSIEEFSKDQWMEIIHYFDFIIEEPPEAVIILTHQISKN
jgi:hypothetical protein